VTVKLDLLGDRQRTHYCGELRKEHAGQSVFLAGWVDVRRDLGNLIFLDLRDHTGRTQIVCNPAVSAEVHDRAEEVRGEYVVGVEGEVVVRAPGTVNPQLATGEVEVMARRLLVLNEAKTPPFPIEHDTKTSEETRLRYRYLDLRRGRLQRNLRLRHRASQVVRAHMGEYGFQEIETPFMTRSTPEGARDYLVPSRLHHGQFYALPQSPQLFKQLLMIGGFDRYYQIVRCFRDEDLRADRQPEFTQIDIEMAFPNHNVLFDIIERMMEKLFALVDIKVERPFRRMCYDEAMGRYGSDKPHLGIDLEWKPIDVAGSPLAGVRGFKAVKALRLPGGAGKISRSQMDKYQATLQSLGVANSSTIELKGAEIQSRLMKAVGEEPLRGIVSAVNAVAGDLIMVIGAEETTRAAWQKLNEASGWLRLDLAEKFGLLKPGTWNFLWVVQFPMFEYDEKEKRFAAMHHPFTSPREEDMEMLETDPGAAKAQAYDLVLNGSEIGGGSIRIHRQDVQRRVFHILGLTEEKARERFGFFLDALEYGTPPHGGIALGFDRLNALMAGESNIREVIAFPKTASAVDMMCDSPAVVDPEQLDELGISIKGSD
jgi:aspartyl-tRNA synthetase